MDGPFDVSCDYKGEEYLVKGSQITQGYITSIPLRTITFKVSGM